MRKFFKKHLFKEGILIPKMLDRLFHFIRISYN